MNQLRGIEQLKLPIWGIFLIAFMVTLTIAKAFFLPLFLAILISLTFSPIIRSLRRKGVPEPLSAGVMVLVGTAIFTFIATFVAQPFASWVERFPGLLIQVRYRLSGLFDRLTDLQRASETISNAGNSQDQSSAQATVSTDGTEIVTMAASNMLAIATTIFVTTILTYFLLAKGRVFYSRILERFSSLADKKDTLTTVYTIERSISRYLFTITIINALLGVAIGIAMWLLGMPSPILWGIAAATLNFLPYIGAIMGIMGSGVVAILTFDPLGSALIVPLVYALLTGLEGQLVTPTFVGRNLAINPVVIFISVSLWTYMWGLAGALIAVPLLVVIHTVALNVEQLSWLSAFISAEDSQAESESS